MAARHKEYRLLACPGRKDVAAYRGARSIPCAHPFFREVRERHPIMQNPPRERRVCIPGEEHAPGEVRISGDTELPLPC
jgi:hypothetical protein